MILWLRCESILLHIYIPFSLFIRHASHIGLSAINYLFSEAKIFFIFSFTFSDIFFLQRIFERKSLLKFERKSSRVRSVSIFHCLLFIRKCWHKINFELSKIFASKRKFPKSFWDASCRLYALHIHEFFPLVYASYFLSHTDPASGKLRVIDQHASLFRNPITTPVTRVTGFERTDFSVLQLNIYSLEYLFP